MCLIHPNIENFILCLFWAETPKTRKFYFFMESGEIKSRSPFSTETDTFYCLEAPGSPWPAAVGFLGLPGSKMYQFHYHYFKMTSMLLTQSSVRGGMLLSSVRRRQLLEFFPIRPP